MRNAVKQAILTSNKQLPLDLITTQSSGAYSLRRLSKKYTGYSCNVQRSSDNATLDIGFIGNEPDLASIISFVGAGSGSIICYDQSGNAKNSSSSTRPQIVISGALQTNPKGKPGLAFNSQKLNIPTSVFSNNSSIFSVGNSTSTGGSSCGIIQIDSTDNPQLIFGLGNIISLYWNGGYSVSNGNAENWLIYNQRTAVINNLSGIYYYNSFINSSLSYSVSRSGNFSLPINEFTLGASARFSQFRNGFLSELIIFPSALSRSDSLKIEKNQQKYYL